MSRLWIVAVLLLLIAAGIAALYLYSRSMMSGISMGGPVPLQSVPPRPPLPAASPAPTVGPSAAPGGPRPRQASASPAAAATAPPAATTAPAGAPKIFSVSLSAPVAQGGQVVTGTVQTSADVTAVQAQVMGYSSPLTRVSAGYFALSYRVPTLPPVLRRTYTIVVTARNAAGRTASSSLPITIR